MATGEEVRVRTRKFFEANVGDISLVPMDTGWKVLNGNLHYEKFVFDAHGELMRDPDGWALREECSTPLKVNWEDIS